MTPAPLPDNHIATSNLWPAFQASIDFGIDPTALEKRTGLSAELIANPQATVTGTATYEHMEMMFEQPGFAEFVVAAVRRHQMASLGVVGLACKTAATVAEALSCHQRFQHLTNRTASYASQLEGAGLKITETRPGPRRLGSLLISDYCMMIAAHFLTEVTGVPIPGTRIVSRRAEIDPAELAVYAEAGWQLVAAGADQASICVPSEVSSRRLPGQDDELSAYFEQVLSSVPAPKHTESLVHRAKLAIRRALVQGRPSAADIARSLGLSQRSFQRRLAQSQLSYGQLLESTRQELADHYLRDETLSIAEVSFLLGYREQASFYRSFRKWHGQSPSHYRRTLRESSTGGEAARLC